MSGIEGTFGNTPASIRLAKILANDEKQLGKVGKLVSTFSMILNELSKVDTKIRFSLSVMVFEKYSKLITEYPKEYNTFISNVITTRYRIWLKSHDSNVPYKIRKNGNNSIL